MVSILLYFLVGDLRRPRASRSWVCCQEKRNGLKPWVGWSAWWQELYITWWKIFAIACRSCKLCALCGFLRTKAVDACTHTHTHKHTIHILSFGSDQFTGKMLSPLRRKTIPRKMCDLNRESGSRSLQTLMTGSAIVRGVNGKETHASHIHHYHDHPPEEEKDERWCTDGFNKTEKHRTPRH